MVEICDGSAASNDERPALDDCPSLDGAYPAAVERFIDTLPALLSVPCGRCTPDGEPCDYHQFAAATVRALENLLSQLSERARLLAEQRGRAVQMIAIAGLICDLFTSGGLLDLLA